MPTQTREHADADDGNDGTRSKDGQVFMPLGAYPFNKKFGWIADRFGVSWQLDLRDPTA
jgi:predicted 3-demethylubiquinone-9 3-methyltransferase (glyoxalase superfamily)